MKTFSLIVFSIFCLSTQQSLACDVCGSGGGQIGLLYNYNQNYIRLSYGFSEFQSIAGYNLNIKDRFQQVDLSLRHKLGKRWRVTCRLPYVTNSRTTEVDDSQQSVTGIGDLQIGLLRILVPSVEISEKATLYLEAGGSLRLPTGQFNHDIHDDNLPENFNVGKGSMGYQAQINSVLSRNNSGLAFHASTMIYGRTKHDYKFGQETRTQLVVFREFEGKKTSWTPNLGVSYEVYGQNKYKNNRTVHGTGSELINALAAVQFKANDWSVSGSYALPISQKYEDVDIDMSARLSIQFSIIF